VTPPNSSEYNIRTVASGREEYHTGSGESSGYRVGEGARRLVLAGTAGRVDAAKPVPVST
jgi:hypothetical protein